MRPLQNVFCTKISTTEICLNPRRFLSLNLFGALYMCCVHTGLPQNVMISLRLRSHRPANNISMHGLLIKPAVMSITPSIKFGKKKKSIEIILRCRTEAKLLMNDWTTRPPFCKLQAYSQYS